MTCVGLSASISSRPLVTGHSASSRTNVFSATCCRSIVASFSQGERIFQRQIDLFVWHTSVPLTTSSHADVREHRPVVGMGERSLFRLRPVVAPVLKGVFIG